MLITLIDDIHRIRKVIHERAGHDPSSMFTLKDILAWREEETVVAQTMADSLFPNESKPHYILAIQHEILPFYKLMFESTEAIGDRGKMKVYASFPVTKAREKTDLIQEAETFRETLKEKFIVFNPMTIGEKILQEEFRTEMKRDIPKEIITFSYNKENYEFRIEELYTVFADINSQIITRDEKLIDQVNAVIAYRPSLSSGAQHELSYAKKSGNVHTYAIHPPEDQKSPFSAEGARKKFDSINEMKENLDDIIDNLKSR